MTVDLEAKVRDATGGDAAEDTPAKRIEKSLALHANTYQAAMPRGLEARVLLRDVMVCVRKVDKLERCGLPSILGAVMTCAQLGLRPGTPLGQAWVLPFWNGKAGRFDAQAIIGYQGFKDLAYRSGLVESLEARIVYEGDVFDVDYGAREPIRHKPLLTGDRGPATGYYAIAFVQGSRKPIVEYLSKWEAEKHRDRFASTKTREGKVFGVWVSDFDAMARKTAVRRIARWLPMSADLGLAMVADEAVRLGAAADSPMFYPSERSDEGTVPDQDSPES